MLATLALVLHSLALPLFGTVSSGTLQPSLELQAITPTSGAVKTLISSTSWKNVGVSSATCNSRTQECLLVGAYATAPLEVALWSPSQPYIFKPILDGVSFDGGLSAVVLRDEFRLVAFNGSIYDVHLQPLGKLPLTPGTYAYNSIAVDLESVELICYNYQTFVCVNASNTKQIVVQVNETHPVKPCVPLAGASLNSDASLLLCEVLSDDPFATHELASIDLSVPEPAFTSLYTIPVSQRPYLTSIAAIGPHSVFVEMSSAFCTTTRGLVVDFASGKGRLVSNVTMGECHSTLFN